MLIWFMALDSPQIVEGVGFLFDPLHDAVNGLLTSVAY